MSQNPPQARCPPRATAELDIARAAARSKHVRTISQLLVSCSHIYQFRPSCKISQITVVSRRLTGPRSALHGPSGGALLMPRHKTLTSNADRTCSASVMGRVASSPRVIVTSPSSCFCSWSARGCHIMPSERMRRAHLRRVIRSEDRSRHYLRLHRFRRPGDGTSGEQGRSRPAPNCFSSRL